MSADKPTDTQLQGKTLPIYVASRASIFGRGEMWRHFRAMGVQITSSWIDEDGEGQTGDFGELWLRIVNEIASAVALVLYAERDDFPLKGALTEAGVALGMGKPVIVCLPDLGVLPHNYRPIGSWIAHPLVTRCDDIHAAIRLATNTRRAAVAGPRGDVLTLITHERERQITEEGYDANHDDGDGHDGGELAQAAAAYALGGGQITNIFEDRTINIWPTSWGAEGDTIKRKPRIRQLVIAGALIVAEIERLQRADGDAAATSSPAPAEKLPLPTDCECIAPSEQVLVINLLRGICDAGKQAVARRHLNLCARCQELAGGVVPGAAQVARERESLIIAQETAKRLSSCCASYVRQPTPKKSNDKRNRGRN